MATIRIWNYYRQQTSSRKIPTLKLFITAAIVCAILSIVSCNETPEPESESSSGSHSSHPQEVTIGFTAIFIVNDDVLLLLY